MPTIPNLRSPKDKVGGIVYFGRMLDKIKLHEKKLLTPDYVENLGEGFDGRILSFLGVNYADVVRETLAGNNDTEILLWCFNNGRKPSDEEIEVWNGFMSKRGWNDQASEKVAQRKAEAGLSDRADIQTMFDFIDADEGL